MSSTSQQDLAADGVFLLLHFVLLIKTWIIEKKKKKHGFFLLLLFYCTVLSHGATSREIKEIAKREEQYPCRGCGFLQIKL